MAKSLLFFFYILSIGFIFGQTGSEVNIIRYVNALSTDSMKVRSVGSDGENNANKFIRKNWGDGKRTSYYSWEYNIVDGADTIKSEMVGSFLYNKAKATILIGAPLENTADVALFLALQHELAQLKLSVNVMLVAVTSMDNGHQGLDYLATHMPKKGRDIRLLIDLNGIGSMNKEKPELYIKATTGIFQELQTMIKQFELAEEDVQLLNDSDARSYFSKGVQCLSISTKNEEETSINTNGILQIKDFLVQWIQIK